MQFCERRYTHRLVRYCSVRVRVLAVVCSSKFSSYRIISVWQSAPAAAVHTRYVAGLWAVKRNKRLLLRRDEPFFRCAGFIMRDKICVEESWHPPRCIRFVFLIICLSFLVFTILEGEDGCEHVWSRVTEKVMRCDVFPSGGSGGKGKQRAMRGSGVVS